MKPPYESVRPPSTTAAPQAVEFRAGTLELVVLAGGGVITYAVLVQGDMIIGRGNACDVRINDPRLSRRHALVRVGAKVTISDLGSRNGTRIGDRRIEPDEEYELFPGDVVVVGSAAMVLRVASAEADSVASQQGGAPSPERPQEPLLPAAPILARLEPLLGPIAPSKINVLLLGETGVGKEVVASAIHSMSKRAKAPFLCINCAAFSEGLLESELFGHEKGAFTGATQAKEGLLESAAGGTVFLDEVGEMPRSLQAKLLRVLEQREVLRVGALRARPIDVRFVAATNRDLEKEVAEGRFREDLFYRLNGVTIDIPPLRERVSDIRPLALAFVAEACKQEGRPPAYLTQEAMELLERYAWPGNVRELRNVMERAVLLATRGTISPAELPYGRLARAHEAPSTPFRPRALTIPAETGDEPEDIDPPASSSTTPEFVIDPKQAVQSERQRIVDALERCAGNQTQAAKLLGVSRQTLVTKIAIYALPRPRKPNAP